MNTLTRIRIVFIILFALMVLSIGGSPRCQIPPPDFPPIAMIDSLLHIAESLDATGNYDSALAVSRKAFDVAAGQEELPDTLRARCNLLMSTGLVKTGSHDSAAYYGETAARFIMSSPGRTDSMLVPYLLNIGRVYRMQHRDDLALPALNRALKMAETAYGKDGAPVVKILTELAHLYFSFGEYERALPLYQRGLNILDHAEITNYKSLAFLYYGCARSHARLGDFGEAEGYFFKAIELFEREPEKNSVWIAASLAFLGEAYYSWGRLPQAYDAYLHALRLFNEFPNSYDYLKGVCKSYLGEIDIFYCRFAEAEENLKSAMLYFKSAGKEYELDVATLIKDLSMLYQSIGDIEKARALNQKALDIYLKDEGSNNADLVMLLTGLGSIYTMLEEYERADSLLTRAMELSKSNYPENGYLSNLYLCLGTLYGEWGKYDLAENNYRQCERMYQQLWQSDTLSRFRAGIAYPRIGLGLIRYYQGEYGRAEACLDSALAALLPVVGTHSTNVINCLDDLARVYASEGRVSKSLETLIRLLQRQFKFFQYAFENSSEDRKLVYLQNYPLINTTLLSLAYSHDSDEVRSAALTMLCAAKSAVLDALCKDREIIFCNSDPDLREKAGRLNEISRLYSGLYWSQKDKDSSVVDSLAVLYDAIDSLEMALGRGCEDFRNQSRSRIPEIADLTEGLPKNTVYCDYVRFEPFDFDRIGTFEERTDSARYMVFTLDKSGNVFSCDLGEASIIDSLINALRVNVNDARQVIYTSRAEAGEREFQRLSRELYDIVVAPLEKHFAGAMNLIVCPDGMLNLIPFEVLYTDDGQYLIEKYGLSYVSSGRELLGFDEKPSPVRNAVVMGDPDFNIRLNAISLEKPADDVDQSFAEVFPGLLPVRNAGDCFQREFSAMPGVWEELHLVTDVLESADSISVEQFSGIAASEKTLRDISAPDILHLATHGFYCGEDDRDKSTSFANPLLRSGLALAGANENSDRESQPGEDTDDGLLTAFEVAILNLMGTDLVVLSACETGMGEVTGGEGVFGLRRAFRRAGARSIIMSMFAVPDKSTSEQMQLFYRNWLAGQTKAAALRNASLSILNERRNASQSTHPLFWGGFIIAGDPR